MSTQQKSKKELNKEKIQQAAFKCVARFGFEKTTMDDIAREVGLNKASLYYYYKNKEEIFLEITTTATRAFLETLQASTLALGGDVKAKVRHFLFERALYYVRMVEQAHISEETIRQVEHLFWEQIQDVEAQENQFLQEILEKAIAEGQLKAHNTARMAPLLVALSETLKRKAKEKFPAARDSSPIAQEVGENLDLLLDLIFSSLR
jgi:TetR/AcrR family transcriptional regulator, biofilm operon repressor